jgi:hypothetical protein
MTNDMQRQVDEAVAIFRDKYPHSTDEQVRLYAEAVMADLTKPPPEPEPDIPMPIITVPAPRRGIAALMPAPKPQQLCGGRYFPRNFSLDDVPPEMPSVSTASEMRDILLGNYGFSSGLSPEQRRRLQTTDMTEDEMLAMLVGAPSAREFAALD